MPLGDFLVAYLRRAGVTHIFGLPGDLVLGLFHRFGETRGLEIVTFSHEPAVGFAADVHHQVKDVEAQCRIFAEVTCDARILARPETAAQEVHEAVARILTESRPGYLEIHRDMVGVEVPVPKEIREWDGRVPARRSDKRKLGEAVADTAARLRAAKRPVVIAGVEVFRDRAETALRKLADRLGAPVVTTMLGKGAFPMDHPLYMGTYVGPLSPPAIQQRVRDADIVLSLGAELTDMNLGASRPQIKRETSPATSCRECAGA